jgi:endoglucanase
MIEETMRLLLLVFTCTAVLFADPPVTDIKVDQAGYLPSAPKIAFVAAKAPATTFVVKRTTDDKVVFRGKLGAATADADSGDTVQSADFSKVKKPGSYYLQVRGVGRSWGFAVAKDAYSRAWYLAMRSFYGQRCGIAVDLGPEFPGYKHEACHLEGAYHRSSGKSGTKPPSGGWHDAGDYGRYTVNSGLSTATLLYAYELFRPRIGKVNLRIPESANGKPDILNEIRWNLDWMLSMQDLDGGVWQKQTSEKFCGFIMPEKDKSTSYVIGTGAQPFKSSCATADLAAVMAIAARDYKSVDAAYAEKCKKAALLAWTWLDKYPKVLFRNPAGVATGEYGDGDCSDERLWAAAELGRTTRDEAYDKYFVAHYAEFMKTIRPNDPPSWANVGALALWSYVLGSGGNAGVVETIRKQMITAADELVARTAKNGYRVSLTSKEYIWGSNSVVANYGVQLLVTNIVNPNPRYVDTALDNLHYLLGRNTHSLSFVTQVGDHPFRHPHHRPSGADNMEEPWPGLLSGGPNHSKQDPAMRKLPNLPPAKMYLDEEASYASNEVAINWNAPLVFLLAGALSDK